MFSSSDFTDSFLFLGGVVDCAANKTIQTADKSHASTAVLNTATIMSIVFIFKLLMVHPIVLAYRRRIDEHSHRKLHPDFGA